MSNNANLLDGIIKTYGLFEKNTKLKFFALFILMLFTGFLELLNIGLLLPLMHVVVGAGDGQTEGVFSDIMGSVLGIFGANNSMASIAIIIVGLFFIKNILILLIGYWRILFAYNMRSKSMTRLVNSYAKQPYEQTLQQNASHGVFDVTMTAPLAILGVLDSSMIILTEAVLTIGATLALLTLAPVPTLYAGTFVVVALLGYYFVVKNTLARLVTKDQLLGRALNRWTYFCLGVTKESRVLDRSDYFVSNVEKITKAQAKLGAVISLIHQVPRVYGEIIVVIAMFLAIAVMIADAASLEATLPLLAVFSAAAFRVFPSVNRITHQSTTLKQAVVKLDEIYPALVQPTFVQSMSTRAVEPPPSQGDHRGNRDDQGTEQPILKGGIEFKNVSYTYPGASSYALRGVDFAIPKGQMIGIIGPSGAGKSTVIDIILGLLPPTDGCILVDGAALQGGTLHWRGIAGYVPQDIFLLDDSIRKNIAIGLLDEDIDEGRVRDVVKAAQLETVIQDQADGLDTVIGERGVRLSGGQKQRIGIARALYNRPQLLILDEATSALDPKTERDINKTIHDLKGETTLIIVAHRLSTVKKCDRLIHLNEGKVAGVGSFEDLRRQDSAFEEMVKLSLLDSDNADDAKQPEPE